MCSFVRGSEQSATTLKDPGGAIALSCCCLEYNVFLEQVGIDRHVLQSDYRRRRYVRSWGMSWA